MSLEKTIEDFNVLSGSREQVSTLASNKLDEIKDAIKSGESTGDKLKDYLIFIGAQLPNGEFTRLGYENIEKGLRELSTRVHENKGKQILLIRQDKKVSGCTGFGGRGFKEQEDNFELGVVNGDVLFNLDRGINVGMNNDVVIPTCKKVVKSSNHYRNKWELKEEDVGFGIVYLWSIGKKLEIGFGRMEDDFSFESGKGLLYYLGDEVPLFFSLRAGHIEYIVDNLRTKKLGDKELNEVRKVVGTVNDIDPFYVDALNLLGLEAPNNFQEVYNARIYKEKLGIVNTLRELVFKEEKLIRRIRAIESVPARGGTMYEGGAITLVEDKDDAFWVSFGERDGVKEVHSKLIFNLDKAVKLGMDKTQWILEVGEKGEQIDVQRYINGLVDKYEFLVHEKEI